MRALFQSTALCLMLALTAMPAFSATEDDTKASAAKARQYIMTGHYEEAESIIKDIKTQSRITNWHYEPYTKFLENFILFNNPKYLTALDKWIQSDANYADAYIFRAKYYYDAAWKARGDKFISDTSKKRLAGFNANIAHTIKDTYTAIHWDNNNPYTYLLLLHIAHDTGQATEPEVFAEATKKFPDYYQFYTLHLSTLAPKWGGSVPQMIMFVSNTVDKLPQTSPLRKLYMNLYFHMAQDFELNCDTPKEAAQKACEKQMDGLMRSPQMEAGIKSAFALYNYVDHYEFNSEITNFYDTCNCHPPAVYAKLFLDWGHEILGEHNYALDIDDGAYYSHTMDYVKSLAFYNKALEDAASFPFPPHKKDEVLAYINGQLAHNNNNLGNYKAAAGYASAAIALDDKVIDYYTYRALAYQGTRRPEEAIKDLDRMIELSDIPHHRLMRGYTYLAMKNYEKAEKDFTTAINNSDEYLDDRRSGVYALSTAYAFKKDYKKQLKLLVNSKFLYSPSTSHDVLAESYAKLCDAYLNTGDAQKALENCNQALKLDQMNYTAQTKKQQAEQILGKPKS